MSLNTGFSQAKIVDWSNHASYAIILATVLWLPIPKAGMMPGALSVLMVSTALIVGLRVVSNLNAVRSDGAWLSVWLYFSIVVLVHTLFSKQFTDWSQFLQLPDLKGKLSDFEFRSVGVLRSASAWGFFTAMWVAAWRVSCLDRKQVGYLLLFIFFASTFQAVYGLVNHLSDKDTVMGLWVKEHYLRDVTGTFVNRNHFSGMLAICWPLVLCGLLSRSPLIFVRSSLVARAGIAMFYSMILLVAVLASHSRMGAAAALVAVCVWAGVTLLSRKQGKDSSSIFLAAAVVAIVVLFAVWFGLDEVVERYTALGSGDSRATVWLAMFDLPATAWVWGVGLGAFEDVFRLVQPEGLRVQFLYAHNDYLEFVLEFGVVFTLVGFFVLFKWWRKVFPTGGLELRAGAIGSVSAIALHSMVDFNLQIPASAFFFWLAVGLVLNPCLTVAAVDRVTDSKGARARKRKRPKTKQEWLAFFRSD